MTCEVNSKSGECQVNVKSMSLRCRTQVNHFSKALETFQRVGLITINSDGYPVITNWNKRQFKSDNVTERVNKFREANGKRNVACNVSETHQITDTDTDTDKKKIYKRKVAVSDKPKRASLTDDEFIKLLKQNPAYQHINLDNELSKMDAWLLLPKAKGRSKTKQFVLNWLNKIDKPIGGGNGKGSNDTGRAIPGEWRPEERPSLSPESARKVQSLVGSFLNKVGA